MSDSRVWLFTSPSVALGVFVTVLCGAVDARAQPILDGALEPIAGESRVDLGITGPGRIFTDAGIVGSSGSNVHCFPTRRASDPGPTPSGIEARLENAAIVVPSRPGSWRSLRVLGRRGSTPVVGRFDCTSGLTDLRDATLPAGWGIYSSAAAWATPFSFEDGSILAVATNSASFDDAKYHELVRLTEGPSGWTGTIVFSTRSLRFLIEPAYLPEFDRRLYQRLTIDDLVVVPDGSVWLVVRQVNSTSIRGVWLVRWQPGAAWDGTEVEVVHTLAEGSMEDPGSVLLDWVPELGVVFVSGVRRERFFVPVERRRRELLPVYGQVPQWVPAHDGAMWVIDSMTGRLEKLRPVPEVADLDGDTRTWAEEMAVGASDLSIDSDDDGVLDVLETGVFATSPGDASSRPDVVEVAPPRLGLSTRVQTSNLSEQAIQWTVESGWSSSPYLCERGRCVDGAGRLAQTIPLGEVHSFTPDGMQWIAWSRRMRGIWFSESAMLDDRVEILFASSGMVGASERGWVRSTGVFPYDTTLPDRTSPHGGAERTLLGVDDATGDALVAVSDVRGQLVLRVSPSAGPGNARVLFRPRWLGIDDVVAMSFLARHDLYVAATQRNPANPPSHVLLDRAMRVVGRLGPPFEGRQYRFGRFFGEGYAVSGPGPEHTRGGYMTWFLAEAVPDEGGLRAGDVVAWGSSGAPGLWVFRENGAMTRLLDPARLAALATPEDRPHLVDDPSQPLALVEARQIAVRPDRAEVCVVTHDGHLFALALSEHEVTGVSLVGRDAIGCAYDAEGRRYTLSTLGLRTVIRESEREVAGGALPNTPSSLHVGRDATGALVWIVDTRGATPFDPSSTFCFRSGAEPVRTGFDTAGLDVRDDVVFWVDTLQRGYPVNDANVHSAHIDDFCMGRAAEHVYPVGSGSIYHRAYEPLLGSSPVGGALEITCDDALFALRPDGRYLLAARSAVVPGGDAAKMAYLVWQSGAWLPESEERRIAAHDGWRRPEAGPFVLAFRERALNALATVPGAVPSGWGRTIVLGTEDRPAPDADAGMPSPAQDAGNVADRRDAGASEPRGPERRLCLCRVPGARPHGAFARFAVLGAALVAIAMRRRGRRR